MRILLKDKLSINVMAGELYWIDSFVIISGTRTFVKKLNLIFCHFGSSNERE